MSLILKGIDMPVCLNEECVVVIKKDKAEVLQTGYKEKTIKAIQIPKGHGNIIDESKAVVTETIDGYYEITAPTILEAEGEER